MAAWLLASSIAWADRAAVLGMANLDATDKAAAGEMLFGELNCTACHDGGAAGAGRVVAKGAPRLNGLAHRLRPEFVRAIIAEPAAAQPGATMPYLLGQIAREDRPAVVDALTAFVLSLGAEQAPPAVIRRGDAARGRLVYHQVGCIACHEPEPRVRPAELDPSVALPAIERSSKSLAHLRNKYIPSGLFVFLRNPLGSRPHGRMPRVPLSDQEIADLVAYLLGATPAEFPAALEPRLVTAGRQHFADLGCQNCHQVDGIATTVRAPPISALVSQFDQGCLSDTPPARLPYYSLDLTQRDALRVAVRSDDLAQALSAPQELHRRLATLNCTACHTLAGAGGPEPGRAVFFRSDAHDLGDEGRFPPPLDYVGQKFREAALENILTGRGAVRSYMRTRMPDFGRQNAAQLVAAFIAARRTDAFPREVVGRNRFGRGLVGTGGMSCVSCHDFAGHPSIGIRGLDLAGVTSRLRPEWFREYLLDPQKFRTSTRMPTFWPDGQSVVPDVLRGDPLRQADSIWVYLSEATQTRLPFGLERDGVFELVPRKEPIVLRTFVKGAGTHAIAVGFPSGVHFAFDAEAVRLALAWQGRFLDAENTWDHRFVPPTEPLGDKVIDLPAGPAFAELEDGRAPWPKLSENVPSRFDGYRLNEKREPILHYRWSSVSVQDHVTALASGRGLERRLRLRGGGEAPTFLLVARATRIQKVFMGGYEVERQLRVSFPSMPSRPYLRTSERQRELLIPIAWRDGKAEVVIFLEW